MEKASSKMVVSTTLIDHLSILVSSARYQPLFSTWDGSGSYKREYGKNYCVSASHTRRRENGSTIMAIFLGLLVLASFLGHGVTGEQKWWQSMSLYQIYPRSYKDSDGDGIGDLKGITSRLQHLKDSNIDAFWLSPFYPSPMVDFGYDISNYTDVDPIFGTLDDFADLVAHAHALNISVIVDFVPNHSSDKHEWFEKSAKNIEPYSDYYVWKNGTVLANGTVVPPNNWVSVFGGPAWEWNDERQAYYLHQFAPQQPDLNYNNDRLVQEIKNVMLFWLDKGVDGFRIDATPYIFEDTRFLDEPLSGKTSDPANYDYLDHIYTRDLQQLYDMMQQWRDLLDEYSKKDGMPRVTMVEAYTTDDLTMKYYKYGIDFPFNFWFIGNVDARSSAADVKTIVDRWMSDMPPGATANWVAGNHDNARLTTRFGPQRAQAVTTLMLLLPGIGVTYYGDEIGMENTLVPWEDTVDPSGIKAGKEGYAKASRDPERTPFQWDNTTSAGFSTNAHTWLPVSENYLTVNLEAEKAASDSFYKLYQDISALRKWPALREGNLTTRLLNDNVFAFSREHPGERSVYVVMNFIDDEQLVDLKAAFDNVPTNLDIYRASLNSKLVRGDSADPAKIQVPGSGVVIYVTPETA